MVKHFQLATFMENFGKQMFWTKIHYYGFQNFNIFAKIFSLGLHQVVSIV